MKRGAILLEMIAALAIFVMASLAITSLLRQGMGSLDRERLRAQAADLARSTMARLESGELSEMNANGPVPPWPADERNWEGDAEVTPDALFIEAEEASGWEIRVETEPSEFEGLSVVRVFVTRRDPEDDQRVLASAELHQLVRLREAEADIAGEADDLAGEAERGAATRRGGR